MPFFSRPIWKLLIRAMLGLLLLLSIGYLMLIIVVKPSNNRDWSPDQARNAYAEFSGDTITIHNARNNVYRSTTDYDVHWETRRYDLKKLQSVWFIVEPFADWRGPAHTFLSFGFENDQYIAISVEIRKEKAESFSPLKGMLRQYELAYMIGDERDLIGLRANHRNDDMYLYKINTTPEKMRALFLSMLNDANALAKQPEFYNTISNTCASNIVEHIEIIAPGSIPFSYKTFLPAYADDLAYDLGLIDTTLPRDQYRAAHKINALAKQHAKSDEFSVAIRKLHHSP
jgi:Domain of unknown function (DUF4105)